MKPVVPSNINSQVARAGAMYQRLSKRGLKLDLVSICDANREDAEALIQACFASVYGATLSHFYPQLLCLNGECLPQGIVGIRAAASESLFLEQYLARNIEQEISALAHSPIDRKSIVEIGNLVSRQKGGSYLMFSTLAALLFEAGFDWMVFTATEQVETIIKKMGFEPFVLCEADANKLKSKADQWGRYYETHPKVMVGRLSLANNILVHNQFLNLLIEPYREDISALARVLGEF